MLGFIRKLFGWVCLVSCVHLQAAELKLLSYNTWLLPFGRSGASLQERLPKIIANLRSANADIVALQEVWRQTSADAIAAGLP